MKSSVRSSFPLLFILFLSVSGSGQAAPEAQASASNRVPVFHAQSKMVVVDVVVSDKSGKAAIGLKASDFQLTENGTSQTICVFEEHSVAPSLQRATPPPLPAGQYTNFPIDPPKNSVNILLFDLLNTRAEDQQWARLQMLKTLQKLPPGQQIALFTLGRSLQMVHGVSGDSSTLVAAANAILARPDSFTEGTRQHQNNVDRITMIPQASGMMNDPATPIGPFPGSMNVQSRLLLALDKAENATNDQRVRLTLQALEAIGRTVSAYPGRKSLIWITSGIPFQVLPNMRLDLGNRMYGASDYTRDVARAASVLADSQIAIYPVDVKGLPTVGLTAEDIAVGAGGDSTSVVAGAEKAQTISNWDSRSSMNNLAHETGGRAFSGSNDLATEIGESIEQGLHYYTLAYAPTNNKSDGLYRNIKVVSERPGLELAYRRGYFATDDPKPTGDEAAKLLVAALQPGMPPATSILMKVRVQPPDASHNTTRIDYSIQADDVQIQETPDHIKHLTLDFMAVAWDNQGRVSTSASDTLNPTLKPEFNMASLNEGIPGQQELALKPGSYVLSLGVMDRNSRRVGTIWMPLIVPEVR